MEKTFLFKDQSGRGFVNPSLPAWAILTSLSTYANSDKDNAKDIDHENEDYREVIELIEWVEACEIGDTYNGNSYTLTRVK